MEVSCGGNAVTIGRLSFQYYFVFPEHNSGVTHISYPDSLLMKYLLQKCLDKVRSYADWYTTDSKN